MVWSIIINMTFLQKFISQERNIRSFISGAHCSIINIWFLRFLLFQSNSDDERCWQHLKNVNLGLLRLHDLKCQIPTALGSRFFENKLQSYLETREFWGHPKRVGLCGSVLGGFWVTCNCAWGRSGSRGSWVLHFRFSSANASPPTRLHLRASTSQPTSPR